ncbi:hypothetical protein ABYF34_02135 [Buchananella felis]|uniref:hypothetical protein n=1 Tax=Buchananella felis TaxID=3231492 RepID=UPI0035298E8B
MTNSTASRKRNRILAAILLPVALLLSACEVKADWTINTDKTLDFAFLVDAPELAGFPDMENFCPSMKESFESSAQLKGATVEVKDLSSEGSPKCEMTAKGISTEEAGSGFKFEDDKVTVTIEGNEFSDVSGQLGMLGGEIKFSMTFTFPGAVNESSVGEIDGNKVTITNIEDLSKGVTIVASMSPSASGGSSSGNLMWILLGVGGLVVVGGVVAFLLLSKKKQAQPAHPMAAQPGYPAQTGYPAQPQPTAPQQGYPTQPQQPMPPQQPYPPQG